MHCTNCGARVAVDQTFCGTCGTMLAQASASGGPAKFHQEYSRPNTGIASHGFGRASNGRFTALAALFVAITIAVTHFIDQRHERQVAEQYAQTIARVKAEDTKALAAQRAKDNKALADLQQRLTAAANERDVARSNAAEAQHEADVNYRVGIILASQVQACQSALYWIGEAANDQNSEDYVSALQDIDNARSELTNCVPQSQ
jgi:predicted proteasome-type protease